MSLPSRNESLFLILNGKSFDGNRVDDPLRAAVARLREQGIQVDVRVTWEHGDAGRFVDEAIANGVQCIVAAGGDGTLSAVASALARCDDPAPALPSLGLVPLGTANDFADAAQVPCEPEAALVLTRSQPATPIDLLRIDADDDRHWCANLASGGFGADATAEASTGMKRLFGGLAYLLAGLAELAHIEPQAAHIHGPGFDWQGEFIALGVGNGRQAGGGQPLCAGALIDDGQLDLTIVPQMGGEVATTLARVATQGKQAALAEVAVQARLPWIEIETPQPLTLNLDGEPVTSSRFRIECVPGRLRMHLPRDCPLLADAATVGT